MEKSNFEELQAAIAEITDLIAFGKNSFKEANHRSTSFLEAQAILANARLELELKKSKLQTLREACYSQAMSEAKVANVTEKKALAEASQLYTDQREAVETIEAQISWVKTMLEVLNNAHVTYRQMSKGD